MRTKALAVALILLSMPASAEELKPTLGNCAAVFAKQHDMQATEILQRFTFADVMLLPEGADRAAYVNKLNDEFKRALELDTSSILQACRDWVTPH